MLWLTCSPSIWQGTHKARSDWAFVRCLQPWGDISCVNLPRVQGLLSTPRHTPMSPAFSPNECLDVQQSQQVSWASTLMCSFRISFSWSLVHISAWLHLHPRLQIQPSHPILFSVSITPLDRTLDRYFNVEIGCSVSSDRSEYLGPGTHLAIPTTLPWFGGW